MLVKCLRPGAPVAAASITAAAVVLSASVVTIGAQSGAPAHAASVPSAAYGMWSESVVPHTPTEADTSDVTVGVEFSSTSAGAVWGIQFYAGPRNTGPRVGKLWSSSGRELAEVDFAAVSSQGWRTATFSTPVAIVAGTRYVAGYTTPTGGYADDQYALDADHPVTVKDLTAWRGLYSYGEAVPQSTWRNSNYYVDVLYAPSSGPQTPTPTPTPTPATTPTASTTPMPSPSPSSPTPSSTPTPTPGTGGPDASQNPSRTNCVPLPSACGYPDATNTGFGSRTLVKVPSEKTSGPGWAWASRLNAVQATGAGAVMDGLDISGGVVIDAPNATLSNSRISACGGEWDGDVVAVRSKRGDASYQGNGARIIGNTILGTPPGCTHRARSGVRDVYGAAENMYVARNDISGTGNGVTTEYEAVVENNWVHGLGHLTGDHHSGLSTHGGAKSIVFEHNTVLLHDFPNYHDGGGVSAALTVYSDFGHAQNVTMTRNLVSGGAYTIFGGDSGDAYTTPATNIKVTWNRFYCGFWVYGAIAQFSASSTGNVFGNNYCDQTGAAVNR